MRDSMKMTVRYQFGYILLTQLISAGIVFLFGAFIFYYFMTINVAKQILSLCLIGVEFMMVYVAAKKLAARDIKPVTPLKYSKLKGVMFGVQIAVLNIALVLILKLIWHNFSDDNGLVGAAPIAYNALFYFWSFACNGLMTNQIYGELGYIAIAAMVVFPIAATTLGYIAGGRNFNLSEHFDKFIYEKDENDDE